MSSVSQCGSPPVADCRRKVDTPVRLQPRPIQPLGAEEEYDNPRRGSSPWNGGTSIETEVSNAPVGSVSACAGVVHDKDTANAAAPRSTSTRLALNTAVRSRSP